MIFFYKIVNCVWIGSSVDYYHLILNRYLQMHAYQQEKRERKGIVFLVVETNLS